MARGPELALPAAAATVVAVAVLGGAFSPAQRAVVGSLLAVVWLVAAREWSGATSAEEAAVLAIPIWGALSAISTGAAPLASKETIVGWVVAWALWRLARRGAGRPHTVALGLLAAGTAAIAVAVIVAAGTSGSVRVGGLVENPNLAAALIVVALPLGLVVVRRRGARAGWIGLLGSALLLTGSRGGLLAALVAAGVLAPRGRARRAAVAGGATLGLAALLWRFVSQPDLLAWHRLGIWRAVLAIWSHRPWTGVGPGCLVEAAGAERILHPGLVGRYQFVISYAESTPLAVLVQIGLVGLALVVAAGFLWWRRRQGSEVAEPTAFRAALAGAVTFGLFHDVLTLEVVLWWWAMVLGCLEAGRGVAADPGAGRPPLGTRATVGLALAWLTLWGVTAPAIARWSASRSAPTTAEVERILRLEPWYADPASARVGALLAVPERWTWVEAGESLTWAGEAVRVHPGLARRWADLGRVHLRVLTDLGGTVHDAEAARGALDRACELDPHLPWHWLERARLERVLGDRDAAVRLCRRALAEEPNTARGWLMLARLELEAGRVVAAREAAAEARRCAALVGRPGLTDYERELLALPATGLTSLDRRLGGDESETR
jgi:O-antigen ligase